MNGFDIQQASQAIYNNIKKYKIKARSELLEILNSAGYKSIFKYVKISEDFEDFHFELQEGVEVGKQDIIEVLCQGGAIKKGDEFIYIKPSTTIRKYLGKR